MPKLRSAARDWKLAVGIRWVVEGLVGFIGTPDNLTVLVAVVVLLSVGAEGEKETCSCKGSENHFDTFHNSY